MTKLSFILPIYNEEKNIPILYEELIKVTKKINCDYELMFIDDKWKDNSLQVLLELQKKDKKIKIIEFSRNFGHEMAVKAWLDNVDGDYIIIMDADLQDPPHIITDMYNKILEWYDVVYAKRASRNDGFFKDNLAKAFYRFINKISTTIIPRDTWNYRIFTRDVLQEIKRLNEQSRFIRWFFAWIGFKQWCVTFDRTKRLHWEPAYTFWKSLSLWLDGIFSFSDAPLRLAMLIWTIFAFFAFILWIYFIIQKILDPNWLERWIPTIIVSVFFIWGIQLIMLWIIWEYIGRIYKETKNRPLYIIKKKYD